MCGTRSSSACWVFPKAEAKGKALSPGPAELSCAHVAPLAASRSPRQSVGVLNPRGNRPLPGKQETIIS